VSRTGVTKGGFQLDQAWAKLDGTGVPLPLGDHGGDVAAVLQALLAQPVWLERLTHCACRPVTAQDLSRIVALSFLHDLGKANRGFWEQHSSKKRVGHTNEMAALFFAPRIAAHPVASRLLTILQAWGATDLFIAAMAHHGQPLEAYALEHGQVARNRLATNEIPAAFWLAENGLRPARSARPGRGQADLRLSRSRRT
jgi:CRISPR-associated endonuclease/helicase Cas3